MALAKEARLLLNLSDALCSPIKLQYLTPCGVLKSSIALTLILISNLRLLFRNQSH